MIEVTDEYRGCAESAARTVLVSVKAGSLEFTADDIIDINIYRSIGDSGLTVGSAISDFCKITLATDKRLKSNTIVTIEIGFDGAEERLQLGKFYVAETTASRGQLEVVAYDKMYQLDKRCTFNGTSSGSVAALAFPCTMQDMLNYVCAVRGLDCDFACQPFEVKEKPRADMSKEAGDDARYYTQRQILSFIASAHAANVCFDSTGKLVFRTVGETADTVDSSLCIDQSIDSEEPFTVEGVRVTVGSTAIFINGSGGEYDDEMVGIVEADNPLASIEIAEYMWNRLGGFDYYSCDFTRRGTGWIETGDVLETDDNFSGKTVRIVAQNVNYSITPDGGFIERVVSVAETEAQSGNRLEKEKEPEAECVGKFGDEKKTSNVFNNFKSNTAEGEYSHAEGSGCKSGGYCSHAEGSWAQAIGDFSHAEGSSTQATGTFSHAEGGGTNATGRYSHAECDSCTASGNDSHAEGSVCKAEGYASHAEGTSTTAKGQSSHAEGDNTAATDYCSHAEGNNTTAGYWSHAEGYYTKATGNTSHAEGSECEASNTYTHAEGAHTVASGYCSHAEGYGTQASASYSHACGQYNLPSGMDLFEVGNGSSESLRNNALSVDTTGKVTAGSYTSPGADYAEFFEWQDGNSDSEDRRGRFVTLDGSAIRLACADDSYILGVVSPNPSVIGDNAEWYWHGRFLRDIYGVPLTEEVTVPAVIVPSPNGSGDITAIPEHTELRPILNPDYDPEREYIPRAKRPEWAAVGLLGKLTVCDDGSCTPGGYCRPGKDGTATAAEQGFRVMERLDESHIKILFR